MDVRALAGPDLEAANRVYTAIHFAPCRPGVDRAFGVFDAGEPIALGRLQRYDDGGIELGGFWVREDHRGAGLARAMVSHVLGAAADDETLWCIPFLHLEAFYRSCGLAEADPASAPVSIREKVAFCGEQHRRGRYEDEVSLLVRAAR